eukprot:UN22215
MPIPPLWLLIAIACSISILLTCICWIWLRRHNANQEESESLLHVGRNPPPFYLWCFHHMSLLDLPPQTLENDVTRRRLKSFTLRNNSQVFLKIFLIQHKLCQNA